MNGKSNTQPKSHGRRLQLESLERRCMLSLTASADLATPNNNDRPDQVSNTEIVAKALPADEAADTSGDGNSTSDVAPVNKSADTTGTPPLIICYIGPLYQVDAGTETATTDAGKTDTSSITPQNTAGPISDINTGDKPADATDAQLPLAVCPSPVKETTDSNLPALPGTCDSPPTGDDPVVVDHFGGIKTDDGSTATGETVTLHPMDEGTDTKSIDVSGKDAEVPLIYTLNGDANGAVVPTTTGATAGVGKHRHEAKGKVLLPVHHDEALTGLMSGTNHNRKTSHTIDDLIGHHGHKVTAHLAHVDQVMAAVLDNPVNKHAKRHG